jgi:prepilin-type N-terminal cleavage/methylation domain-containing protein
MKVRPAPLRHFFSRGFSLIELLMVMAIIAIISALVVPAVNGFGRSGALTTGGNLVANLANFARQEAVSKNTMTALVVLGAQGTTQDYRAVAVLEYSPIVGWSQVGNWEVLPVGILVDPSDTANCTFLTNSPDPFPFLTNGGGQKNPPILYQGQQVGDHSGYAARIYLSNGALQNPDKAAQLRLVEAYLQGTQVIYTSRDKSGKAANYYDIAIIGMTGTTKISRPGE